MGFTASVISVYRNMFRFGGRASRAEYWWFALFQVLLIAAFFFAFAVSISATSGVLDEKGGFVADSTGFNPASMSSQALLVYGVVFLFLFLIPSYAVLFRRLHDTDKSAWWLLITLLPFGNIVIIVFTLIRGTEGPNRFGPDPYQHLSDEALVRTFEENRAEVSDYYRQNVLNGINRA